MARYGGDHQRWYSQYCELMKDGLVNWTLGHAFITDDGAIELYELSKK